jgi:hypothetical protein
LENVWVTDATDANCSVNGLTLLQCPPGTNLAGAIVTDAALCDLTDVELLECGPGTNNAGAVVTDELLCNTAGPAEQCPAGTDLAGVWVVDADAAGACSADGGPELLECPAGTALEGVAVSNTEICDLHGLDKCADGTDLEGAFVMDTDGFTAFDDELPDTIEPICNLADGGGQAEVCQPGTDLAGVHVVNEPEDCEIDLEDVELELCPPGTALEGIAVQDDGLMGIPAACTVNGLEKCPAGTDKEGLFAMGDGDVTTTVPADLTLTQNCDESTEVCPAGTALAGVVVEDPIDDDPNTVPKICSINGLEKCPALTDLEGVFAMGDGDLATTVPADLMLTQNCDLPDSTVEICPPGTVLEGVVVQDPLDDDPMTVPAICTLNGLEKCPALTDLEGVFAMGDGDLATTVPADLMLTKSCEKWDVCPAGTALAGVTVEPGLPDTTPMDGTPDICTVQGLEKCPAGTPQEGHFVMGDGNIATNSVDPMSMNFDAMLATICNARDDQSETCPDGTQLEGILVKDTVMDPNIEPACNPFEICPANTALAGVAVLDDDDPMTPLPAALCTLNGLEKCPPGTDEAGHFVMGDGNPMTTFELLSVCDSLDIAIANDNANNVHIRLGTGTGSFGALTAFTVQNGPQSVALADFNGDGFLDFVTANFDADSITVRLGNGLGSFGSQINTSLLPQDGARFVAVGFFDADTDPDVAIANYNSGTVSIRLGDGDGTFTAAIPSELTVGTNPRWIALGFFNNDAIVDMAVANEGSDSVSIFTGDGDGTFTAQTTLVDADGVGDQPFSVAVGFFNNDANADLAVANFNEDTVSIFLGDGDGTFTPATPVTVDVEDQPTSVAVGNFNPITDTFQDIVTTNFNDNTISVRLGDGDGTFTTPTPTEIGVGADPIFVTVADFNGDGYDDLAVANNDDDDFSILLNSGGNTYTRTDFPAASEPWSIAVGSFN